MRVVLEDSSDSSCPRQKRNHFETLLASKGYVTGRY